MTSPNSITSVRTHFGHVTPSQIGPGDHAKLYGGPRAAKPLEYKLSYINNLPIDVTVAWRSGLKFTLPSIPSMSNNTFLVRVEILMAGNAVTFDAKRVLSAVTEASSPELKAMRKAFDAQLQGNTYNGAKIVLDYPITLDQLKDYGGTIYYHELDCVLSILAFEDVPPHPHSDEGQRLQVVVGSIIDHNEAGFGYSVEIIDSYGRYGDRYLNIANKVYKVSAKKDPTKRDGIYIVSNHSVQGELGMNGLTATHYPFEGAEEILGLYKTYSEALSLGDMTQARKLEIASLEHQITLAKQELQQAKQRHEIEMVEMDRRLKDLALEHEKRSLVEKEARERAEAMLAAERLRVKDYFEDRSYVRKEQSEMIKFLPSIIVGIGAIFMAMKTLAAPPPTK